MISATLADASTNLVSTYLTLARHAPGSRIIDEGRFLACTGDVAHAMCNFAARLNLCSGDAERLACLARDKPVFNVYSLPGEAQGEIAERLAEVGFRRDCSLVQMTSNAPEAIQPPPLISAVHASERLRFSTFMADLFFEGIAPSVRGAFALATAASVRLELCGLYERNEVAGAAMLHRAANHLGIYNLCVAPAYRGRGYGSAIVSAVLARAADLGMPVTLQCNRRLAAWYGRLGFEQSGTIEVYGLSNRTNQAIMK